MPATSTLTPTTPSFATEAERYDAIRRRDAAAEGRFFTCVLTTGVYCRPTCKARLPLRRNVVFHATAEEAERAGFRACKRCHPRDLPRAERQARIVEAARALIDASETPPALEELAAGVGVSRYHLHRLFKQHAGMTPREYGAAVRLHRVTEGLSGGAAVTDALYDAGYSSSSRFYDGPSAALGMAPSAVRRGAPGVEIGALVRPCSLGLVLVGATSRGVCAVAFGDDPGSLLSELRRRFPRATIQAGDESIAPLAEAVVALVDTGMPSAAEIPLDLVGTLFQQRVWRALRDIPAGSTATYADIAERIGSPRAVRAVGTACGENPVAVAVPCHRVVRSDGTLGGYRWGLDRKRALLAHEKLAN